MATLDLESTLSKAAVAGHPLHPLLVTLPVGSLVLLLVSDLANRATSDPFWAEASIGVTGSATEAVRGRAERVPRTGGVHAARR